MMIKYVKKNLFGTEKYISEFKCYQKLHTSHNYGGYSLVYDRAPNYTLGIFWLGICFPVTPAMNEHLIGHLSNLSAW